MKKTMLILLAIGYFGIFHSTAKAFYQPDSKYVTIVLPKTDSQAEIPVTMPWLIGFFRESLYEAGLYEKYPQPIQGLKFKTDNEYSAIPLGGAF